VPFLAHWQYVSMKHKRLQKFPLRLSPAMHEQVQTAAKAEGISLNRYISLALAEQIARIESTENRAARRAPTQVFQVPGPE
jgi:hypothetical protein